MASADLFGSNQNVGEAVTESMITALNQQRTAFKAMHDEEIASAQFIMKARLEAADQEFKHRKQLIEQEEDEAKAIYVQIAKEKAKIAQKYAGDPAKMQKAQAAADKRALELVKLNNARIEREQALEKEKKKNADAIAILNDRNLTKAEKAAKLAAAGIDESEANSANNRLKLKKTAEFLANYADKLNSDITNIANARGAVDTRLQGSRNKTTMGSYWKKMGNDIVAQIGMNPFVQQSAVTNNIKNLVGQGIAFNVEQRAFLETIKDKIATTFEAADGTLLKLVRVQQQDTTAARLGMESALTSFLNNMYETTEYMQSAAKEIRSNLYEASALMTAESATQFEYQVQKWMGSLYSVGFSNTSGLSSALGKLAAGDVSAITSGGYGNLMVMAANAAGLSIADILADGLDDSSTNQLMQAMVNFLGGIYNETKGSRVVQQQMAGVYGLTASDLKAAANLSGSVGNIAKNGLSYNGMMSQLNNMYSTMWKRTSTGEGMQNMLSNLNYSMANSMANNPALYALYTMASMLTDVGADFNVPGTGVYVTGNGTDGIKMSTALKAAAMSGGILGGIGRMLGGLVTGQGGVNMLKAFGVGSSAVVSRGTGGGLLSTGMTTSASGYAANSDSSDVTSKTMTDTAEDTNSQIASAQDESGEVQLKTVNSNIVEILNLLQSVVNGDKLKVELGDISIWSAFRGG